jgi:hypothetical protein
MTSMFTDTQPSPAEKKYSQVFEVSSRVPYFWKLLNSTPHSTYRDSRRLSPVSLQVGKRNRSRYENINTKLGVKQKSMIYKQDKQIALRNSGDQEPPMLINCFTYSDIQQTHL